jgi:hypothetical protein
VSRMMNRKGFREKPFSVNFQKKQATFLRFVLVYVCLRLFAIELCFSSLHSIPSLPGDFRLREL